MLICQSSKIQVQRVVPFLIYLSCDCRAETKLSSLPSGYTLEEAQAIMTELRNIQHSLSSGEKEKAELMASLSRLRDDLTRLKPLNNDMSPDLSTLSLPQEKFSTASQTDLSGMLVKFFLKPTM